MKPFASFAAVGCTLALVATPAPSQEPKALAARETLLPAKWFKGNTHTHSLWSDGNDFPEMIVAWYAENGYDFIALSDHNILATGEKWMALDAIAKRQRALGRSAMQKYQAKFGEREGWIETRKRGEKTEVRLKRIDEYRPLFEKPGEFLVVQAEEISNTSADGKPVHINAVNLPGTSAIPAVKKDDGLSVTEVIRQNLQAVAQREEETGEPILAHLNHPNFQWAITPTDLAEAVEERFFEVYNGHPGINHLGRPAGEDGKTAVPSDEAIWDIVNTMRIAELDAPPLFGVATDDSHTYHGGDVSPGRGWVMVGADQLEGGALIEAMKRGDFFASTGVHLDLVIYDPRTRLLNIRIRPDKDATFTTEIIGTRKSYNPTAENGEAGIGEVFETVEGNDIVFRVPDDALYLRATITSSRRHPNPSFPDQKQQAWTQPVGWRQ